MLYLFYGPNREELRAKVCGFLDDLLNKTPGADIERIYPEEFSGDKLDEFVLSRGLFGEPRIIVMEGILGDDKIAATVLEKISEINSSPNMFIFLEEDLDIETVEILKDSADKIFHFKDKKGGKPADKFNIWSITDALGRRDRKALWIFYQKALLAGIPPEEIHSILVWQVKNIILAKKSGESGAEVLGMKPFVFNKAKSFARNWSEKEIMEVSSCLVGVYHESRIGIVSFEEALEKLILEI